MNYSMENVNSIEYVISGYEFAKMYDNTDLAVIFVVNTG